MQRINFIDSLKGIGILAVILGHIANPFANFIYLWHMPLFFIISGFFININKNFFTFVKKNALNIMIPYFIFGILGILVEGIKDLVLQRNFELLILLKGLFFYMDFYHLQNSYALILWFLPALFFAKIFTFLLSKHLRILIFPYITIIFCILYFDINLPFALDIGFIASIFSILGYFLFISTKASNQSISTIGIWGGVIASLCTFWLNYDLFTYRNFTWQNHIFFTISFCVFLYFLTKKFEFIFTKIKIINYFGHNSMLFYIFHIYTNNIANVILKKFNILNWMLIFIFSLVLLITLTFIFKNIFKRLNI